MRIQKTLKDEKKKFVKHNLPLKSKRKKLKRFDEVSTKVNSFRKKVNESGFAKYMNNLNKGVSEVLGGY